MIPIIALRFAMGVADDVLVLIGNKMVSHVVSFVISKVTKRDVVIPDTVFTSDYWFPDVEWKIFF